MVMIRAAAGPSPRCGPGMAPLVAYQQFSMSTPGSPVPPEGPGPPDSSWGCAFPDPESKWREAMAVGARRWTLFTNRRVGVARHLAGAIE